LILTSFVLAMFVFICGEALYMTGELLIVLTLIDVWGLFGPMKVSVGLLPALEVGLSDDVTGGLFPGNGG